LAQEFLFDGWPPVFGLECDKLLGLEHQKSADKEKQRHSEDEKQVVERKYPAQMQAVIINVAHNHQQHIEAPDGVYVFNPFPHRFVLA
jgi:hypothetical protein